MMFVGKKYDRTLEELGLRLDEDRRARDVLDSLVGEGDFGGLKRLVEGKVVFVFGCGPSLKADVKELKARNLQSKATLIAADGAVKALLEKGVVPQVCVTDLDGDPEALQQAAEGGCLMVVHAHGDNIEKLESIVPTLVGKKLGTTQSEGTSRIRNFGGFTDGDRAVYLAAHFNAKKVVLFGMDFGLEPGEYSGKNKDKEKKIRKLDVGKKLLEELAGNTNMPILNATKDGADIANTRRVRLENLELEQ